MTARSLRSQRGRPASGRPLATAVLERRFPGWTVTLDDATGVYYAERQAGTAVRVLAAYRSSELAKQRQAIAHKAARHAEVA